MRLGGNGVFDDLPISTSASADGVYSAKIYFREIKLCKSLNFSSGTGYTVDGTCATVYENFSDQYKGLEGPTEAERATMAAAGEGKFYDILSAADRAKLNRATAVDEGEYNWGIVETHPWVKLTAKSGVACTKSEGAKEKTAVGGDGVKTYYTTAKSLACGSGAAEEILMYITNANSTFKFQKPFVLKKDEEFTVDLAFNLDSEVRASKDSVEIPGNLKSETDSYSFYFPMLRMGAAPRKSTETTKVETYTFGTAAQKEQIRLQLYYNSADTSKAVLGANATVLATAASTKSKANKPLYTGSYSQEGDTVTMKTWDGTTFLTFTRGAAGTATLSCSNTNSGAAGLEVCSGVSTLSLTYDAPVTSNL